MRADRIECLADGRYAILDYKTGTPPTEPQVRTGLSPQLTLEAAILRKGGFKDIPAGGSVAELLYVRLRGGAEAGEEHADRRSRTARPTTQADHALAELTKVLAEFADPKQALLLAAASDVEERTTAPTIISRACKEWSLTGGADDDGGGE